MAGKSPYYDPGIETMPLSGLRELQNERIRELVQLAYARSPFYREKFDRAGVSPAQIRGLEDLPRLPLLTKEELRAEQTSPQQPLGRMITFDPETDPQWGYLSGSGGTTGAPVFRNFSLAEWRQCVEACKRSYYMIGVRRGDRGYFMNPYEGHMALGMPMHPAMLELGAGHTNAGIFRPVPLDQRIQILKTLQPTLLFAGPSFLRNLGEELQAAGVRLPVRRLVVAGEPGPLVSERYRQRLAEPFGLTPADVYDMFGSADATLNQMECPAHAGIHLWVDLITYEVLDPRTHEPVPPGRPGILTVTTTYQKSHPWIRYYTEDYAIIEEARCACGRTHPRLTRGILGRLGSELFIGGKMFLPAELEGYLAEVAESTGNYQVERYAREMDRLKVTVELKPSVPLTDTVRERVRARIERQTGVPAQVEICHPGKLEIMMWKSVRIVDTFSR